jgi:hypothetical protein
MYAWSHQSAEAASGDRFELEGVVLRDSSVVATCCADRYRSCPVNGANRAEFKETISRPR